MIREHHSHHSAEMQKEAVTADNLMLFYIWIIGIAIWQQENILKKTIQRSSTNPFY